MLQTRVYNRKIVSPYTRTMHENEIKCFMDVLEQEFYESCHTRMSLYYQSVYMHPNQGRYYLCLEIMGLDLRERESERDSIIVFGGQI